VKSAKWPAKTPHATGASTGASAGTVLKGTARAGLYGPGHATHRTRSTGATEGRVRGTAYTRGDRAGQEEARWRDGGGNGKRQTALPSAVLKSVARKFLVSVC
jgi:hypothetical protein